MQYKGLKKYLFMSIGLCLLFFSSLSFAGMPEKLTGHWANALLDEKIIIEFFPNYADNNFEKLAPASPVSMNDSLSALNLLYRKYHKPTLLLSDNRSLSRQEILPLLAPALTDTDGVLPKPLSPLQYQDCSTLKQKEIQLLQLCSERGILNGSSPQFFNPDKTMTQSEAILIVQRLNAYLTRKTTLGRPVESIAIPFQTVSQSESYNSAEGWKTVNLDGQIRLIITKQFSSSGYHLAVRRLKATAEGILVELNIDSPPLDSEVLTVITYITTIIEINSSDIPDGIPHRFLIDGIKSEIM